MAYQTTRKIMSLANGGFTLGARQSVTPDAFTSALWRRLLADGSVIELEETAVSYNGMTLAELRAEAKKLGLSSSGKKSVLLARLKNA